MRSTFQKDGEGPLSIQKECFLKAPFFNMTICRHEDELPRYSKRCKFLTTALKDAFSSCHMFYGRPSASSPEEDCATSDAENDHQEEEVVSEIRARAMEKLKRKSSFLSADSFSTLLFSPSTGELYMTPNPAKKEDPGCVDNEGEEFCSAATCFSMCPSKEGFVSAKTDFSSFNRLEPEDLWQFNISDILPEFRRRSIILEFSHCEGWPFGLCRKVFLLPPLPKSPSDSWTWRKMTLK